jgi:hypothetical protein
MRTSRSSALGQRFGAPTLWRRRGGLQEFQGREGATRGQLSTRGLRLWRRHCRRSKRKSQRARSGCTSIAMMAIDVDREIWDDGDRPGELSVAYKPGKENFLGQREHWPALVAECSDGAKSTNHFPPRPPLSRLCLTAAQSTQWEKSAAAPWPPAEGKPINGGGMGVRLHQVGFALVASKLRFKVACATVAIRRQMRHQGDESPPGILFRPGFLFRFFHWSM